VLVELDDADDAELDDSEEVLDADVAATSELLLAFDLESRLSVR
jgi:hypothetical protein